VIRIGVDMASVSQIAHSLSVSTGFAASVFTLDERETAGRLPAYRAHEYLAGRFAVKEAVLKALHLGIEDQTKMREIEVFSELDGSPSLRLAGSVAGSALAIGLSDWQVSISHNDGLVVAFVLLS